MPRASNVVLAGLAAFSLLLGCEVENTGRVGNAQGGAAQVASDHPLDQMAVAFVGGHHRETIRARMDEAMRLYDLALTRDNYSRAGSVLVTMRRDLGPSEMEILAHMIRSHVPGGGIDFPGAAAISAAFLASARP